MEEQSTHIAHISVQRSSIPNASTGFAQATFPGFMSFSRGRNLPVVA